MHEFAEEYVANLKPRNERYDTRLGDDFYVATFPNGVKTWSFVFEVNGFTRRQTLGVYPEMPLPQALEALYAARRTRAVEAELSEKGLDDGQVRKSEDSPINLTAKLRVPQFKLPGGRKPFVAGVMTGAVVCFFAVLASWIYLSPRLVSEPADRLANVEQKSAGEATGAVSGPEEKASQPADAVVFETEPVQLATPPPRSPAVSPGVSGSAARLAAAAGREPAPAGASASEGSPGLSESQIALRRLQQDMAGTLAWAQLTSQVINGEPVDQLEWVIEVSHSPRRVFYFVRVRGMAGAKVTYRWRHEGNLLKEDIVEVGEGWHSPAYSGMTLTAERLGRWQVEVYGPDGTTLGTEEFEARMASDMPRVSRR